MIKKRKPKKKTRKKTKNDNFTSDIKIIKKKKKKRFLGNTSSTKSILPQKRKKPDSEFKKPKPKKRKMDKNDEESQEFDDNFFRVKDAKERKLRFQANSDDFIPLNTQNKIYMTNLKDTIQRKYESYDKELDDNQWEISQLRKALGRNKFENEFSKKKEVENVVLPTEVEEITSIPFGDLKKTIGEIIENNKVQKELLEDELKNVNEKVTKFKSDINSFENDVKYLDEKYKYFQEKKKFVKNLVDDLDVKIEEITKLRNEIFILRENFYKNKLITNQNHTEIIEFQRKIKSKVNKCKDYMKLSAFSIKEIKEKFEHWKFVYTKSYFDAHIGLCVRKLFEIYVLVELLDWNLFTSPNIDQFNFWKLLINYGQVNKKDNDEDDDLIPYLVKTVALPIAYHHLKFIFNPISETNTKQAQNLVKELSLYLEKDMEFFHNFKTILIDRFFYVSDNFLNDSNLERIMLFVNNVLSWVNFDSKNISCIPLDNLHSVLIDNLMKKRMIPAIKEISLRENKKNDQQKKQRELFRMIVGKYRNVFKKRWIQSIYSVAQSLKIAT